MSREKLSPILVYVADAERAELQRQADENLRSLSSEGRLGLRAWVGLDKSVRTSRKVAAADE